MTSPIAVDPSALAAAGRNVSSEGDAAATATQTLSSALSGAGALFGHDSAGIVFGQGYTHSGQALLDAAESAVNACRRVGFGMQMSASNYGKANAASTVGGGESPVPAPTEPPCVGGLTMPPPMGGGVAAPLGWALVEQFVGDVWPDGNPAQMHAAATAWRGFAAAIGAAAGPVSATGTALGGQQIPESGKMVEAVGNIGSGLSDIAAQAQTLASHIDAFAANVQATQDAVRDLLHQLSPGGVLETIGGIFTGHNPMDKIKQVASEIKTVLNNMKREADASNQLFSQGINALDSATDSLESWAKKEFISVFGEGVGNALSSDFNAFVDLPEGGLKFVAQTAHGLEQLDPTRFAYDTQGALDTWKGLAETAEAVTNPVHLAGEIMSDPQGSLNTVKGLVDWEDVEKGHPFRALGYDVAQVGSLAIPGGEAAPAVDAASAETRVAAASAGAETRTAGAATRDAGAAAATRAAGATEDVATRAAEISSKLDNVQIPESAAPGSSVPGGRAPVEPPVPQETPRVEPTPRAPEVPHGEPPVAAEPHTTTPTEPHVAAPHNDAPAVPEAPRAPEPMPHSAEAPSVPAAEPQVPATTAPSAPHMEAPPPPSAPEIPSASQGLGTAQPFEHAAAPSQELASVGAENHSAESAVNAGDHAPVGVEHGPRAGESGSGHGGSGDGHGHTEPDTPNHEMGHPPDNGSGHEPPDPPNNPPHTGLHDPPVNHGVAGESLPDLSQINNEFRLPDGSVDPARFHEWAERVSDAYPEITKDGVEGVYDYTTQNYEGMNPYLRSIDPLSPYQQSILDADSIDLMTDAQRASWEERVTHTDEGLASLPPYRADPSDAFSTTWRGMHASDSFLEQFNVGEIFHDPAYLSTSADARVAENFALSASADRTPTLLTVEGYDGVGVSALSRYANEFEVLFPRGTDFEVISREMGEDGVLRIVIRQVRP
ncbi:ADP-ribosyltransferase [Mycobacterium sp.]|uniref:ADP-ribosyltransferase n=1 Tax=Mycobacterium sp. TaxID=1785 RepID=UPI002CA32B3E|nr:ADP-ribosyltransferase [Mycobacterium sp.]HKP39615.1 ADP-ribosyltransferase [Mycobacterium sp.]